MTRIGRAPSELTNGLIRSPGTISRLNIGPCTAGASSSIDNSLAKAAQSGFLQLWNWPSKSPLASPSPRAWTRLAPRCSSFWSMRQGDILERRGPLAVAAAENRVVHAGERFATVEPIEEFGDIVRWRAVVCGTDNDDDALGRQPADIFIEAKPKDMRY